MLDFNELDFTIVKFHKLCSALVNNNYVPVTMEHYLSSRNDLPERFVIMRHDIDKWPKAGLRAAHVEKDLGLKATYYFRTKNNVFVPQIIKEIEKMGHEVGYHYENLSTADGDYEKAIGLFEEDVNRFREICTLKTICMHGASLSKHDNRDLWNKYDFRDFGILGEAYLSVGDELNYFTDTGRGWNSKSNLRDFIPGKNKRIFADTTDNLIGLIERGEVDNLYITLHPERWSANLSGWGFAWVLDLGYNSAKAILRWMRK
jgi:hypothetical protein